MVSFDIENSFNNMPDGEPFICSFSGGKDSMIALSRACERGEARGIIHWFDDERNESVFHHQNIEIMKIQAECMNMPLIVSRFTPWKHRLELIHQYEDLVKQGIRSIIFGDIYLEDSAKMQYVLCKKVGLIPRFPLWGCDCNDLFMELETRKIRTMISRVNTAYLDECWLGKEYDRRVFEEFEKLGIDPFGEKGEFHTTVVDADIFQISLEEKMLESCGVEISYSKHELKDNIYYLLKN